MVAVIGLFGMIFAWTKIAASRATKIPIADDSHGSSTQENANSISAPSAEVSDDSTPDWLKNTESPFGSEDILSKEVSSSNTESHTPDWMNDHEEHTEKQVQSAPAITPAEPAQSSA